jgi:O-antigen/teichoic acid export membrane protein
MTRESDILTRLRRGFRWTFFYQAIGRVFLFAMHSILGRVAGAEGYGIFSYAITVAGLLAVLAPLGWPMVLVRFIAQYIENQEWGLLRGLLTRAHQVTLSSSGLAALLLWGMSRLSILGSDVAVSLRYSAILLPFLALVRLRSRAAQGLKNIKASVIPENIILPLTVILACLMFKPDNGRQILIIYVGGALVTCFLGGTWLWRSLPSEVLKVRPQFQTREWSSVSLPLMLGGLGYFILNRTDVLMLGAMADIEAVGLYSAANRIALLNIVILGAMEVIAAPMFAEAFHAGRHLEYKLILRKTIKWSILGTMPFLIIMIVWPENLLSFFGENFLKGGQLLQILAVGQFFHASTGCASPALSMTGKQALFAKIIALATIFNVIGNFFAIPYLGATGAAIVTVATTGFMNSMMLWQALKKIDNTGNKL